MPILTTIKAYKTSIIHRPFQYNSLATIGWLELIPVLGFDCNLDHTRVIWESGRVRLEVDILGFVVHKCKDSTKLSEMQEIRGKIFWG